MHQINEQRLESIEIKQVYDQELQRKLMQIYKENDIPECHQKYFYNILKTNEQEQQQLMEQEIQQIRNQKSVVKTLLQLTQGRERCIKEFQRMKYQNTTDQVNQISKYLYDLRKLTLNLLDFHRKWKRQLESKYRYPYQWIYNRINYIQKIHDDFNIIKTHHVNITQHFKFKDDDIFFMGIIDQAQKENIEYYEYLQKHKMKDQYINKMNDLLSYYREQMELLPQFKLEILSSSNHALSPKFPSGRTMHIPAVTTLPTYQQKIIYIKDDIQFNLVQYPLDNLEMILHYFQSKTSLEYIESFKYPISHIKDILLYWQEANIIQINDNGILICSIDHEFKGRRWIIHLLNISQEQKINNIIQQFIKMLQTLGDPFTSLAICCTNGDILKQKLEKFTQIKKITYNQFNVVLFEQKIQSTQLQLKRQYLTPITLKMIRIFAEQQHSKLITDQELLTAQLCSNLGKNNLITFEQNILTLSTQLNKNKLYGQEYMLIHKIEDIYNKYQITFDSPIKSPVYFQQFNIRLNFRYFTSEIHRNNNAPYLRLIANNLEQEPSILELQSTELNGKLYLVSTLDPGIKIFIYETQQIDNIQQTVNQLFEKFDKKTECKQTLWLPQFKCQGKQLTIQDAILNAYFQNDTFIQLSYPRIPALHSISYTHDLDKLIQPPFLIGIVQSDIDNINKPLFSILIKQENILLELEKQVANPQNYLMTFQPREIDTKINELLKISTLETQQSFTSDPRIISSILKYGLEVALLNLQIGYALIHVDENHLQYKRWIIESIMINKLDNLQNILIKIIDYIFTSDPQATEIQISQTHFSEQGELTANKQIMDAIKKAKFKWRLVDNDAKTQIRKTIYYYKNPNIPKQRQTAIQFRCYYAIQQSQERNQVLNQLNYLKTQDIYQFFEDCFQYHVKGNGDNDPFVWEKLKLNPILPNTEFKIYNSTDELQSFINTQLPNFGIKYQMMNTLQLDIQLKFKRLKSILDNKYIEIPNIPDQQQIYQSDIYQMNSRIIYIPTMDSSYFIYIIETQQDIQTIKQNYLNITNYVTQAFTTKYNHTCKSLLIPQFKKNIVIQEQQNYLNIEFALCVEMTIEQMFTIQENTEQQWKIQQPMIVGILNTQIRTQFERPLLMMVE